MIFRFEVTGQSILDLANWTSKGYKISYEGRKAFATSER